MAYPGAGIPIDVKLYVMLRLSASSAARVPPSLPLNRTTYLISSVSSHPRGCNLLSLIATTRT